MTKTEAKKLLTVGNHKLASNIITWDIPASQEVCGRTCPSCYAIKAQKLYPAVLPSRGKKLELSKSPDFVPNITKAINILSPTYVRIHASGEFYSQEYINKWEVIAKATPQVLYAYTKRLDEFDFSRLKLLKNVVIINSLQNGRINYGTKEQAKLAEAEGMFVCPDQGGKTEVICGNSCTYCMTKEAQNSGVFFVKH